MALAVTHRTEGVATGTSSATASVTIPAGHFVYVTMAAAQSLGGGGIGVQSVSVSGLSLTWSQIGSREYGSRRTLAVFRAHNDTGSDQTGTITISAVADAGVIQERMWSVDSWAGVDTTTPNGTVATNETSGSSLVLTISGTPDTGDRIFASFAHEDGANGFALEATLTQLGSVTGGGNVRQIKVGYDATDPQDTSPSVSSSGGTNANGGIGFIINAAAGGGAFDIVADAGSYALTGTVASLEFGRLITAAAGSYAVTGTAASLIAGKEVSADSGSYSLSGTAVSLLQTRLISAVGGSYSVTGTAAGAFYGRAISVDPGSYTISGNDVNFVYGKYIDLTAGSYALTGITASLLAAHKIDIESGSYSIAGTIAALNKGRAVSAESGSYSLTGSDASLLKTNILSIDSGSYSITGMEVALSAAGATLLAEGGSYVLSGTDVSFRKTWIFSPIDPGEYIISGKAANLIAGGAPPAFVTNAIRNSLRSPFRNSLRIAL